MSATLLAPPVRFVPPVVDDATRREFLALVGAAGLLSGCSTTLAPPAASTRTVTGLFGPVEIPVEVQRLAATYDDSLGHALALGMPVVAAPGRRGSGVDPFPSFLPADQLSGVERFGTRPELNFEAIAAARPDCILHLDLDANEELYSRLSAIAPTFVPPVPTPWAEGFLAAGEAFGRGERARELVEERRVALDQLAREVAAGPFAGATHTLIATGEDGTASVFGPAVLLNVVLVAIGLRPSPVTESVPPDREVTEISAENLGRIDADLILVSSEPAPGTEEVDLSQQPIRDQPTWQALNAVQGGNVISIPNVLQGSVFAEAALRDLLRSHLT